MNLPQVTINELFNYQRWNLTNFQNLKVETRHFDGIFFN
jgi:hypothetical protein